MGKLHFFPKNHMEKLHFFPKICIAKLHFFPKRHVESEVTHFPLEFQYHFWKIPIF